MDKKTILITGGAGFIGSHLTKKLLNQGHTVLCVDNFFTGRKDNILEFLKNPNFELIRHDVTRPLFIECDEIYNLACPASPPHYQYNAVKTIKCSTIGMINILGLAKRTKAKILHASTSEIYGDPLLHPQKEDYFGNVNPIGIRSCYDEGKRVAECLCMDYNRMQNVNIKIVRIFNTYGPNMDPNDGRVVSNFIMQALQNKNITIYGTGMQTRSFQYVDDLIDGMIKMMNSKDFKGPVNLGNPDEFKIIELAEKIIKLTNSNSKIIYEKLPGDDPKQRKPDINLAKEKLSWKPLIELNEGLKKTIPYFKNYLNK
ncbi:MAG: UDP-glucuronic acid decarboxylase family protein, partial [Candidatus Woesearchaeota archaeon]